VLVLQLESIISNDDVFGDVHYFLDKGHDDSNESIMTMARNRNQG
jgi:hypothetical protein